MGQVLLRSNRDFRLLFSAASVSNLGDGIAMVALPWLATLLTHDPLLIAAVATAQRLPWLLFALPVGVLTDRADRRLLMVRADLARVVLMVCILGMVLGGAGAVGPVILSLIVVSFLFGTAEVIRDNAAQTILPAIVASQDLEQANGQMWSAEKVTGHFIGPPLAGLLIGAGVALPFGVDASLYALSACLVWLIALPPRRLLTGAPFWAALREGLGWMRAHPAILRLAVMLAVINAVFVGGMTILVLYAQEVLHLSAAGYGLLLTAGAFGGVLGGLASPRIAARLGMRQSLLLALGCFVLVHVLLALFASTPLAAAALFLEAASGMLWNVVTVSYRQRLIPDALLGRVNSVYRFFGWGAMPFGALGAGALVAWAEPALGRAAALHAPYYLGAAACLGLLGYAALRLRFE
ncbi:MFS transporter [Alphaproteobacteria bacterium KMM 3653]|uniref:MFS transporter n=1 Tax=Harenicola maris TaxID=2841044 RepID=A0AAP2G8L4_9RHOB|nr:MFS transporter [Harenicola maris]